MEADRVVWFRAGVTRVDGQFALIMASARGGCMLGRSLYTFAIVDRSKSLRASMRRLPSSTNSDMACLMSLVVFSSPSSKISSPIAVLVTSTFEIDAAP